MHRTNGLIGILVVLLAVLLAGGCATAGPTPSPTPTPNIDWDGVEAAIRAGAQGAVLNVAYDVADDFLVIEVSDATTADTAAALACETVLPALDAVESRALFALYSASGQILASWSRCLPTPTPSPSPS